MRVWKDGCDVTRILIGCMPSDARFDWLVGNMSAYQENLFQSRIFLHLFPSFVEFGEVGRILDTYGNPRRTPPVCITVSNSPNSPWCLDEAMETQKTSSSIT